MISIFTALAIISVFEILPSRASPVTEVKQSQTDDVKQTTFNPEEVLAQMANVVNSTPELINGITDLAPEKIAQMMPHLKECTRILKGSPLGELFGYLENLCDHHQELLQARHVTEYIDQLVQQNVGQAPITIKNKTKIKLVYAPQYGSPPKEEKVAVDDEFAKEVAGNRVRIAQEAVQDLQRLRNHAQAANDQLSQQLVQGNETLLKQMREVQDATKKEMAAAINSMETDKQRAYDDLNKAVSWLRQQMEEQMGALTAELAEKKKYYQTNVDGLASNIRQSLDKENEEVEKQVSKATENLKQRLTNAGTQMDSQLAQARAQMNDEVNKAVSYIEVQVKDIREKMQAAMNDLKKDMENVDAELKQSVTNAYNGARKSAMDPKSQAEVEKTVAEMKKATEDMRGQMESEIRKAIQALSAETKSILMEIKRQRNGGEISPAVPPATGNIRDSPVGKAAGLVQGGVQNLINNNNGGAKKDTKGGLDTQLQEIENELDTNDLEFDDFEEGDFVEDSDY